MISLNEVERQLQGIGVSFRFWGRAEVRELTQILVPAEQIKACVNGRYKGGFALLVATDQRLLLVDKKLFHLTVEDVRYDMVAEVDYGSQFYSATLQICTPTKTMVFMSYKPRQLRGLGFYLQQRVMEMRQYTMQMPQQAPQSAYIAAQVSGLQDPVQTVPIGALPALPTPTLRNPYTRVPLLTRRRIGRTAVIPQPKLNY